MKSRRLVAIALALSSTSCLAERRCGFKVGCEDLVLRTRYRAVVDDVPPRVLSAAACKWKGDQLMAGASCDEARARLEELVRTDPDCAQYRDAGPVLQCHP